MNPASPEKRGPGKDYSRCALTPAEKNTGRLLRRVSFHVLTWVAVLSMFGAAYWWYLWSVTVRACFTTYIFQRTESILLVPGRATSWEAYFVGLDISSFSALTLALLFTRLAYCGIRNTLWRRFRDGERYYEYAYDAALFTKPFESLCIQFGLLGTLLSFLLAAVAQMSGTAGGARPDTSPTLVQRVEQVVGEPSVGSAAAGPASPSAAGAGRSGTRELSSQIFLLLCASLVSTFVGTFAAYVVIPPLNLLNGSAVGTYQRGPMEGETAAEEFFRQLDRVSQRLGDFERATAVLVSAADGVERFEAASRTASGNFARMIELLDKTAKMVGAANQRMDLFNQKIGGFERQTERAIAQIRGFANELQGALEGMSQAASRIQLAAVSGDSAFQELGKMARSVREPLARFTHASNVTWQVVAEVRDSLRSLAAGEQDQCAVIGQVAESLQELHGVLRSLLERVVALAEQDRRAEPKPDGAKPSVLPDRRESVPTANGLLSWWRRYFG